jgi:hypothetical protein
MTSGNVVPKQNSNIPGSEYSNDHDYDQSNNYDNSPVESFDNKNDMQQKITKPTESVHNSSHLLPLDQNSQWAALNPVNAGNVAMPDLLQAGYHIGLDTIGQTLRNANYQYRSDPIIPKVDIGPWNQSTIEADYGRVPLEIGQCAA